VRTARRQDTVEHLVVAVGAQRRLHFGRQIEAVVAVVRAHVRGDRGGNVGKRLVVGLVGRLDRRVVADHSADREQRRDRRQQQAEQVCA
jgi:hypothetical protein